MHALLLVSLSLAQAEAHYTVREDASLLEQLRGGEGATFALLESPKHGTVGVERSGRFFYAPAADYCGDDSFSVRAGDDTILVSVAIAPENDAPAARADLARGVEDAMLDGAIVANDIDGDSLAFSLERKPKRGRVDVEPATGHFRFTPPTDWFGDESFSVSVTDGRAKSVVDVNVLIAPANDAPRAEDTRARGNEDAALTGRVVANDIDGDALRFALSRAATKGAVTINNQTGEFTYTPRENQNGDDDFLIDVSDGKSSSTARVAIELKAMPDAPILRDTIVSGAEDEAARANVDAIDPDGDRLTFRLLGAARMGDAQLDAATGAFSFTPRADMFGEEDIAYEATDGQSIVNGTLKLRIAPKNDVPVMQTASARGVEDEKQTVALLANDIDGDALRFDVLQVRGRGRASINGSSLVYEPAQNENGNITVRVAAKDGESTSAPVDISLSLDARNDAPVIESSVLTVREDDVLRTKLVAYDPDGDGISFAIFRQPLRGFATLDPKTGALEYMPNTDVTGTDDIRVEVVDPSGLRATAHFQIVITAIDDVPTARSQTVIAPKMGSLTAQLEGRDAEGRTLTFKIASDAEYGNVEIVDATRGTFTYKSRGQGQRDAFTFIVTDGKQQSKPATVEIQFAR
jgi:large repetitive protein